MQFSETLEVLEQMFEQHKLDNRDIQDFRQTVDECIARQVRPSAGGQAMVSVCGQPIFWAIVFCLRYWCWFFHDSFPINQIN